jgi:hypothetical protein
MTLEGWAPDIGPFLTLEEVVEQAFDYRGNVTVATRAGREIEGYLFNRDRTVAEPFVQLFDLQGDGPITVRYADIATIRFTGKDTAAGGSWKAWLERKEREQASRGAPAGARQGERSPDPHRR